LANIAGQISNALSKKQLALLKQIGAVADELGLTVYIVGGPVRDVLLSMPVADIDLAVEGNAILLARRLARKLGAKAETHPRFGTATLSAGDVDVDLATVRSETYQRPGALPTVGPGSLEQDLARRDFTVNAMAVSLAPGDSGRLIDSHDGMADLKARLIRVLHDKSFTDDATRILRAIRYEQRLNFKIDPGTQSLIKRDISMLDTISGDRLRHELEMIIDEKAPLKALRRADELGILKQISPSLNIGDDLAAKLEEVFKSDRSDRFILTVALLTYGLDEEYKTVLRRLNVVGRAAQTIKEVHRIKGKLDDLSASGISNSGIYRLCQGYQVTAISAFILAEESTSVRQRLKVYLEELQHIQPLLSGDDLKRMGITTGRKIGSVLKHLMDARLDGKVQSKSDEERLVKSLMRGDKS